jgi:hypothetical protein
VPGYQSVSVIAAGLRTDEKTLLDFRRKGWIQAVERKGTVFLSADQRYRAKFILYLLQTKHLDSEQIELVLATQQPPYSAAEVDKILKRHGGPAKSGDGGA